MRDALFFVVAGGMLVLGTCVVTLRNLFHAALALLGTLFGTAVLFLLLGAEFVALAQVMVYIGGIMVFVLYAVFLTSDLGNKMPMPGKMASALTLITAVAFFAVLAGNVWTGTAGFSSGLTKEFASLHAVGERLLDPGPNGFLVPFELVSVLLLAALVGALAVVRGVNK